MSFTSVVKDELSKLEDDEMTRISELSGIIHSSATINDNIVITTENNSVARRIFSLIKDIYDVHPKITVRKGYNYNKKMMYILEVKSKKDLILSTLGIDKEEPEGFILADDELSRVYLRGVFLMNGSINDPKTSRYHLEFNLSNEKYSYYLSNLLNEYNLNSKVLHRDNNYMVYIKEAEKIGDFLRMVGANKAVLYYEDIRIYRDHKNMANRLNNCEQANVDRIIETSNNQINDIELIKESDLFDLLDERERVACEYRLKYPDASLLELSEIISLETGNKITKSGLYHRFNKIKHFAQKIKDKNKS